MSQAGQIGMKDTKAAVDSVTGTSGAFANPTTGAVIVYAPQFTDTTAATLVTNNGYFATAAGTYTLPAAPAQGDLVIVYCDTAGAVAVTGNAGQSIRIGSSISAVPGNLTSSARGDCLTLRYRTVGSVWCSVDVVGNWTVN